MAIRLVPKQIARTGADAEAWIVRDTGGAVVPTGNTTAIGDGASAGWAVEVFSTDGLASPPAAAGRVAFRVVGISPCGTKAILKDAVGFQFEVPRSQQELFGGSIQLQINHNISASIISGTQDEIKDVVIEDDFKERRKFDSVASDVIGWEPRNTPAKPAGTGD